jgi:hypothetical protein
MRRLPASERRVRPWSWRRRRLAWLAIWLQGRRRRRLRFVADGVLLTEGGDVLVTEGGDVLLTEGGDVLVTEGGNVVVTENGEELRKENDE